ncbi:MAG: glutamine synthetase [Rhodospirillales bacterium]
MQPHQVRTAADARKIVLERNLTHVKVGVFDMDGILRGKYLSRDKFFSAIDGGFGFCDVVLGWDSADVLYDNVSYTGWHTAYPDAPVRILPNTCRALPKEMDGKGLLFLCEFAQRAEQICPRGVLRKVIERGRKMGFDATAAVEYEFFLFDETPQSIRDKGYRNLKPITPDMFGYSVLRATVWAPFHEQLLKMSAAMDFPIEGYHTETGPGVVEAAIAHDGALRSADKAALFKTFTKVLAQQNNMMATFMAKWSADYPGQSGHIHLSLKNKSGKSAFYDAKAQHRMSKTMRHFVAGQQALMPQILAMVSPTVNSYTRMIPGHWAPTVSAWGVENRTCALRVIPGSEKSQRVEYRIGAADGNPYLGIAAALASGLYGIEQQLELGKPIQGNAYEAKTPKDMALPPTLWDAAQRLKASKPARDWFGDAFVDHFAATREWEERESRKHISDWQLNRYFEII